MSHQYAEPMRVCQHHVLGTLLYSEDDEAWSGRFNDVPILVAYTGMPEPDPLLVSYAASLAQDRPWLEAEVKQHSDHYALEHPGYKDEVHGLALGVLRVYGHKGIHKALLDLEEGHDYRAWRLEFTERECDGIGFDS